MKVRRLVAVVVLLAAAGFFWRGSQRRAAVAREGERSASAAGSAKRRAASVSYPAAVPAAISPVRKRYTAEVPFPVAVEKLRWWHSLLGEVVWAIQKLWGDHPRVDPGEMHGAETRHPQWAPAMEEVLKRRFSSQTAAGAGLPGLEDGLEARRIDCRTSSCRIQLEYPASLDQVYTVRQERHAEDGVMLFGRSLPLEHFLRVTGPLGTITQLKGARREATADPRLVDVIVLFSADEIDPNRYPAWVAHSNSQTTL